MASTGQKQTRPEKKKEQFSLGLPVRQQQSRREHFRTHKATEMKRNKTEESNEKTLGNPHENVFA